MDAVPRISRAQSLDVLSSMANIAGYRAVVEAAHELRPLLHRAGHRRGQGPAGQGARRRRRRRRARRDRRGEQPRRDRARHRPAPRGRRAGPVAGRRRSSPSRSPRRQVAPTATPRATARGLRRAGPREIYAEQAADVDIVITTALIPGRPAPRLITADDVARHEAGQRDRRHGRGQGGNVEGSVADEIVVTANGVIDHRLHRPRRPAARAGLPALRHQPGQPDEAADAGQGRRARARPRRRRRSAAITVVRDGEMLWPPPPVAGVRRAGRRSPPAAVDAVVAPDEAGLAGPAVRGRSPSALALLFAVDRLRAARRCHPALHGVRAGRRHRLLRDRQRAPRAAHAADVGDQRDLRDHRGRRAAADRAATTRSSRVLAFVAILLASINVFGGFAVTRRMLAHVHEGADPSMTAADARPRPPTSSPPCCSSSASPACPSTRPPGAATPPASPAWRSRSSRPSCWRRPTHRRGRAIALLVVAMVVGARDRALAGRGSSR